MKADTDAVITIPSPQGTIAEATMIPTETIPGHATRTSGTITGVLPSTHTPMPIHITLAMTPHIRDHLHKEAPSAYSKDHSRS